MKKIILIIMISISSLSCYDGLNDMLGNLDMKVPICVNSVTGSDIKDGRGWANAKATIQAAIDVADTGDEIWVAGDWSIGTTITVNESVSIYGGFNGSESWIEQRPGKSTVTGNVSSFNVKAQGVVIDGFNFNAKISGNCILLETDGIYSITIINCEFNNNTTWVPVNTTCSAGNHHTVLISKCTFYKNTGAGAITALNSDLSIIDTSFTSNTTDTSGGAINISGGSTVNISNSTFTSNYAAGDGGAIYAVDSNTITITGCTFSDNNSVGIGGAIIFTDKNAVSISDSDFISNYADNGGALHITKQSPDATILSINGCDFDGNYTAGSGQGGAVYLDLYQGDTDTVNISKCDFIKNNATSGGAVYLTGTSNSKITITDCDFGIKDQAIDTNTASGQGGALYISGITAIFNNTDWYNNTAATGGGAIYTNSNSSLTIQGGTFTQNQAPGVTGVSGGAILAENSSPINLSGVTFTGNSATAHGGAIYITNSTSLNITGCRFGSSSIADDKNYTVTGAGGALYINASAGTIDKSYFYYNESGSGGGIYKSGSGLLTIVNCLMAYNKAAGSGCGGAIYISVSDCEILFSSLINNIAGSMSHGIYATRAAADYSTLNIHNSIVWSEEQSSTVNRFLYYNRYNAYISFNCVTDDPAVGTNGSGSQVYSNKLLNPLFTDISKGIYTLTAGSPCVNAGINSSIPSTDIAGNPRLVDEIVDMGCYERQ